MHHHQAILQQLACGRRRFFGREDVVLRQQAATADAIFRIIGLRFHPLDHLHARPNAARILPTTARAAQPFAQNGTRRNDAPFCFGQLTGERGGLARGTHTDCDQ